MLILALALQATTTCHDILGTTTCRTIGSADPAPIVVGSAGFGGLGIYGSRLQPTKREKKAGKLLAAGNCEGAVKYALSEGDFQLAGSLRNYCRNNPK